MAENWQILTKQNSVVQCSHEQEMDNSSNQYWITSTISVSDNLRFVTALEDSGSRTAMLKIQEQFPGRALEKGQPAKLIAFRAEGVDGVLQAE